MIYLHEINDGLEEKITASLNEGISYGSELFKLDQRYDNIAAAKKKIGVKAGDAKEDNDPDLYYLQSIMVTANWNKNDDVFKPEEILKARYTPINKPTNVDHREKEIIGHITSSWLVDNDYNLLEDGVDAAELPGIFHVMTGSVIYKTFDGDDYKKIVADIIKKIEAGEKYVSMECRFAGFDYALTDKSAASHKIVARNDNTSWLTKHLRAYGGSGEFNNMRVGRALSNIRFIAHGFVDKPANINSIIFKPSEQFNFAKAEKVDVFENSGVLSNEVVNQPLELNQAMETNIMSDTNEKQVSELKDEIKGLKAQLVEANDKVSKANIEKYENEIKELTAAKKKAEDDKKDADAAVKAAKDAETETKKKFEEASKQKAELAEAVDKYKTIEMKTGRMGKLKKAGAGFESDEDSGKFVDKFTALSDEQFDAIVAELVSAAKKDKKDDKKADDNDDDDKEKDSADAAAKNALDNIEKKQADPAMGTASENKVVNLQTALASQIRSKSKLNINRRK